MAKTTKPVSTPAIDQLTLLGPAPADTTIDLAVVEKIGESKGVVYTRSWVVDLILDLAGYRSGDDLAELYAVEPAAGQGAFLVPMVRRLVESLSRYGRSISEARDSLRGYELDRKAADRAARLVIAELERLGVSRQEASELANGWVVVGDYLLNSQTDRRADLVVGNPPYIRYDNLPTGAFEAYQAIYPTMVGRGDIYIGFIEAGIRQLKTGGVLAFICADRWMRSAYGAELRRLISKGCGVEAVIEMHNAQAFEDEVAAYPAIVVIRRGSQTQALVASASAEAGLWSQDGTLADALGRRARGAGLDIPGFKVSRVGRWFKGGAPWPSVSPELLDVLHDLEARHSPLEDAMTGTRIGIGVATGADGVFITKDATIVEPDRLLPLAMSADTRSGRVEWSGHFLIDPWDPAGNLVDLHAYPRLASYFDFHRERLERRNIARRRPSDWYRTIDRVMHELTKTPKLYFPDMKLMSNPTLDPGGTYPHHNLYFLTSDEWDLEVLGGLLLSRVAQFFIEAYCVKMRGGTLRFQAQYLRRIRVPSPGHLSDSLCERLRLAFVRRDVEAATAAAVEAYGAERFAGAFGC